MRLFLEPIKEGNLFHRLHWKKMEVACKGKGNE
jgi:hypothetical protein